jgi:hypothetical protein
VSLSGPGAPLDAEPRPSKVSFGLAHLGDEPVIALTMHPVDFLTPVSVAIGREQAYRLLHELEVALAELPG